MTDYSKLVEALRETAKHLDGISRFPYDDDPAKRIYSKKMTDAAAAIEALQAEVIRLNMRCADCEYGNSEWPEDPEHTKMPKRGEWKTTDAFPHRVYCSKCFRTYVPNDRWQIWVDNELPRNYCPNCGAKMEVQE